MKELLRGRIHKREVDMLSASASGAGGKHVMETLYSLIHDPEERIAYNALWILTHLSASDKRSLLSCRNDLIDILLVTRHVGKQRLLLSLLEDLPISKADLRIDYLDFCLTHINSQAPYAIRAFCIKQAFAQCRFYPELLEELKGELEILQEGIMSPGLKSACKNILNKIKNI